MSTFAYGGPQNVWNSIDPNIAANPSATGIIQSLTGSFIVGGNVTCSLSARICFILYIASPVVYPTLTCTNNLGLTFKPASGSYGGNWGWGGGNIETYYYADYTGSIAPGKYDFYANVTTPNCFPSDINGLGGLLIMQSGSNAQVSTPATLATYATTATLTDGIHNTKNIYKIICPQQFSSSKYPYGLYVLGGGVSGGINIPYTPPIVPYVGPNGNPPPILYWSSNPPTYTASTNGSFFGNTAPINNLGVLNQASMPWNILYDLNTGVTPTTQIPPQNLNMPYNTTLITTRNPVTCSAYYVAYPISERQTVPYRWQAATWYPTNYIILDSNGNYQTMTTPTGGLAGAFEPSSPSATVNWGTTVGAMTVEGGYSIGGVGLISSSVAHWQCTKTTSPTKDSIVPAVARQFSLPSHPCIYSGSKAIVPSTFTPQGWWIYSITPTRNGSITGSFNYPKTGSAQCQVGCLRNGTFVQFGTGSYTTGTTYRVNWPIFTPNYLIVSSSVSESINVEALAISCGNNFTTNGTVSYPICGAYVDDMSAMLSLLQ
jgi:hypothetical protein